MLHHRRAEPDPEADATLRMTRELFLRLIAGQAGLRELIFSDALDVEGSRAALWRLFSLLEAPEGNFAIVRP